MSSSTKGLKPLVEQFHGSFGDDRLRGLVKAGAWRWPHNVRVVGIAAAVAALLAGAIVLYRYDPATAGFFPPCQLHSLTGLHCPGCGSTRAMHALLHADLPAAVGFNPLLVVATLIFAVLGIRRFLFDRRTPIIPLRVQAYLGWGIVVIVLLFAVVRNLPIYPFTILAP